MSKYFLPNDYARCDNERCDKRNSCARYLDILPFDGYFYCGFNENGCDFYIEKIDEYEVSKNNKRRVGNH